MSSPTALLLPLALLVAACATGPTRGSATAEDPTGPTAISPSGAAVVPDLPVSQPPFERVEASWKDRMEVPYAYMEHRGSYAETGALIPGILRELEAQGLEPDGVPFALFYDDPGTTPGGQLRSRACVPLRGRPRVQAPLRFEVLPSQTVAYAFAGGAYPEVPRSYPGLFAYMRGLNWDVAGPVRESYLVAPAPGVPMSALVTEVQVPVRSR